jgi:hypothetical protein
MSHCVGETHSESCIKGPRSEASGRNRQKKLKEGEACSGFAWGGEGVVRRPGALSGTRRCVKKTEERNGKQQHGIESPYIHNSFFPPRD